MSKRIKSLKESENIIFFILWVVGEKRMGRISIPLSQPMSCLRFEGTCSTSGLISTYEFTSWWLSYQVLPNTFITCLFSRTMMTHFLPCHRLEKYMFSWELCLEKDTAIRVGVRGRCAVSQVLTVFVTFACILSFCVCIHSHGKPGNFFVGFTCTELRGLWGQLSSESLKH